MKKAAIKRTEKSERYDLKLKEILHAAAQVFAEKGFHKASVRDVSRASGASLAGLYYYFQTKEELLFLILENAFDSVLENLDTLSNQMETSDKIRFFIHNHLRYFVENLAEMKVVSHESDALTGVYSQKIQEKKRAYFRKLVQILNENQSRRRRLDPRLAALALFGMVNWVYTWYDPQRNKKIEEVSNTLSEIFLRGYLK
ncbi:MAG: TetR/AcrR family transcriptional regulator [Acidobacteria bacterium]|nr:TetR/AcrR family transcriptional regulator [Acidobacteriota bacterium]